MALFTEEAVRANLRVRDGKKVFYLGTSDRLTPAAREWLRQQQVLLLPAEQARPTEYRTLFGAVLREKPEHMTHLYENVLVEKDHPRIRFRGMLDALEAELLLTMKNADRQGQTVLLGQLREILEFVRSLIPCDVMDTPVAPWRLCGFTPQELRERSHFPQKYYDQPHFMPAETDPPLLLELNRLRTLVRQTELAAFAAYRTREGAVSREDILTALNRLSSLLWILMIQGKAEVSAHGTTT